MCKGAAVILPKWQSGFTNCKASRFADALSCLNEFTAPLLLRQRTPRDVVHTVAANTHAYLNQLAEVVGREAACLIKATC
jgi:hypothetical protein